MGSILSELEEGVKSPNVTIPGTAPLGGDVGYSEESPYIGKRTRELETGAMKARREIVETQSLIKAFGQGERIPKPKETETNVFQEIFKVIDAPGRFFRQYVLGIPEGEFSPMADRWMGLTGKESVEVPLPFNPPVQKPTSTAEFLGFKPSAIRPETLRPEPFQPLAAPDPTLFGQMAASKGAAFALDTVTDPLAWLGFGTITRSGGRALVALQPFGPFTGPGKALPILKGQAIQEGATALAEKFGQTGVGRVLGKAFIPHFGLPEGYHLLQEEMKRDILHNTIKVNRELKQLFTELNPDELRYVTFSLEHPEMLDNVSLSPILAKANPTTADFIRSSINPGNVNLDKVNRAAERLALHLENYSERLIDAGILNEEHLRPLYVPHMLEPESPLGFPGTKMPTTRSYTGKISDERPFFTKERTHETLVDNINGGYRPLLEADLVARQFSRAAEVVLAKRKFVDDVLGKFGTQVIKQDMTDFEPLLEQGYKLYMPKGNLRFYPQFIVPKKEMEGPGYLINLSKDDIKRGIGVSKTAPAYLLPGTIADDMNRLEKVFGNNEAMNSLVKLYDRVLTFWKGNVTVTTPGFHARNEMGNVFNAWLGGLNNPVQYNKAWSMAHGGANVQIGRWNSGELMDMATQLGVYKPEGAFMGEITRVRPDLEGEATIGQLVNPLSQRFAPVEYGRKAGSEMENNARLALFIDRLEKGDAPTKAAQFVKKYLFDYGELTPFEQQVMRRAIPFYTWMRKNVPLQMESIFTSPGKYSMVQDLLGATQAKQEAMLPYEQRPWYEKEKPLSVATSLRVGGLPTLLSPDLPISDLGLDMVQKGESITGSIRGLSPVIQGAEQIIRFFGKREARVAAPEIYAQILKALPEDVRKDVGLGDVESFITGKPVPGMNKEVKLLLINSLPLIGKLAKLVPTEENLANPQYIGGITSTMAGTRLTPVDVRQERAKSILNYRRRLEDELKIMFKEGAIDAQQYNFARRFIRLR